MPTWLSGGQLSSSLILDLMEVPGPGRVRPGKTPFLPTEWEDGWAPQPVSTFRGRENSRPSTEKRSRIPRWSYPQTSPYSH